MTIRLAILGLAAALAAPAQVPLDSYRVETLPTPKGIAPEVSAIAFTQDGQLAACFRRGYIYLMNPKTLAWRKFASGLHTPLGILAGKPGEFFVTQVPELTRVADTDGDGVADVYETLSDEWGMSGNYHEFIAGPVRDAEGNLYVSLGLASGGASPRPPGRGEVTLRGRQAKEPKEGNVNRVYHYSAAPYRGCAVKITPLGKMIPISCGFRQPNGLGFNAAGDLFAADNQGDWVGTSPLHHVTPGAFHGHPSSLTWDPSFGGRDPVEAPIEEMARRRKLPAIQFPQNDMAGSVASPLMDATQGKFGPYSGQMFLAEWTYPRILRADLEKVGGQYQGAAFLFIDGNGLRAGNNRLAFAPDGRSLYVAQTQRIWGSAEGLQRVVFSGRAPMDILTMRLTRTGFELTFTKPVEAASAASPEAYSFTHYYYMYHAQYGSPKTDVTPAAVTAVEVSPDRRRVRLTLDKLVPGRVYELRPGRIRAQDGEPLSTRLAAYTLNRLLD